ncbi:elongation factor Ts [Candidatus Peregrinibacteria bacterium]|nr:elongation factor Ts [Candidatus Peregrinibacteria bacterium]
MTDVSLDLIKKLREMTGVSMMACKSALAESNGDLNKAVDVLRAKGEAKAVSRSVRSTTQGVIISYIHPNFKVGSMVHLGCETDFVAKNTDFQALAKDIAMHIAASSPLCLNPEDVPSELIDKEKDIWREQLKREGKPEKMWDKILEGKENKFRDELSLLKQAFVKNPEITISQLLTDTITKLGENIKIEKFVRYSI